MILRIGARGSALSQAQARLVVGALQGRADAAVVTFRTTGDRLSSLGAEISGKGVFTKEIDEALLDGRVDLGVHSLKDLPSDMPDGLVLAAVPVREDPRDVLLSESGHPLALLPPGSRIGTGSPRRRAQLLAARPDCPVSDARGNVDTRIRRMREGRWEAIVLARAGLARLGRLDEVTEVFEEDRMLPAIGQGALALVTRAEDEQTRRIVEALDDAQAHSESDAERELLRHLEAGCRAPLAGLARASGEALRLTARVFSRDGERILEARGEGSARNPRDLGRRVAEELLQRGAGLLITEARAEMRPKVLVVRSGGRPFFSGEGPPALEVRERVSHAIVPCLKGESALDSGADMAIFTSQVAVDCLLGNPDLAPRLKTAIASGQTAAVGNATAATLARYGMPVREIGDGSARSLLDRLSPDLSGQRILLPRGEDASTALEDELRRRGAAVEPLVLYRKVPRPRDADLAVEIVRDPFAAFCVTATSAARWLFEDVGPKARERLRATPAVALGPSTRRFLLGEGVSRVEVPHPVDFAEAARLLESLAVDGVPT